MNMSVPSHMGFFAFIREKYVREMFALVRTFVVTAK